MPVKVVFCICSSFMKRLPSLLTSRLGCMNTAGTQSGPMSELGMIYIISTFIGVVPPPTSWTMRMPSPFRPGMAKLNISP